VPSLVESSGHAAAQAATGLAGTPAHTVDTVAPVAGQVVGGGGALAPDLTHATLPGTTAPAPPPADGGPLPAVHETPVAQAVADVATPVWSSVASAVHPVSEAVSALVPPPAAEAAAAVGAEIADQAAPLVAGASAIGAGVGASPVAQDLLDSLSSVTANELLTGAMVTGIAALALSGAGRGSTLTATQIALTSARVLPHTLAHTAAEARNVARSVAVGLRDGAAPLGRPTIRATYPPGGGPSLVGWSKVGDEAASGWTDSRIMMQLAMLLGLVYAGFVTVWMWATRLRPQHRSA
jgi:hypothetical protein